MTTGEIERAERILAAQRKQADALERIAASLEKGITLLEQLVDVGQRLARPRPKRPAIDVFRERLAEVDTGDKAVALWMKARKVLQQSDAGRVAWEELAKRLVDARRFTKPADAAEWLKAQVAQAEGRQNNAKAAPARNGSGQ